MLCILLLPGLILIEDAFTWLHYSPDFLTDHGVWPRSKLCECAHSLYVCKHIHMCPPPHMTHVSSSSYRSKYLSHDDRAYWISMYLISGKDWAIKGLLGTYAVSAVCICVGYRTRSALVVAHIHLAQLHSRQGQVTSGNASTISVCVCLCVCVCVCV